jgi:hypothetical protein
MIYGFLILLLAFGCYVANVMLVSRYSHSGSSGFSAVEARTCEVPRRVHMIGVLAVVLAFIGIAVLLVSWLS